jgi:membrane-bound metal-dependent hydrolase YbcI (DUF457 family)
MDIISHALWTNLIFKETPDKSWAIFFGIVPDLISFGGVLGKRFFRKVLHYTDPPLASFPKFVFTLYNWTHSLVIWLGVFLFLKLFNFDLAAIVFCGWGLHILLDIFTHKSSFFPTPIFWPFSKLHFSGINWSNKYFMLFNYAVLLFLYLVFYFR